MICSSILLFWLQVHTAYAQTAPPEPEDVINAVNEWRASKGIALLKMDSRLMESAQAHSEFQARISTFTYYSADRSDVTDRALEAGFGDGDSVSCREALAFSSISTTLDTIVKSVWDNAKDRDLVLLNPDFDFIGAGVARMDASVFYTVDVCRINKAPEPTPTNGLDQPTAANNFPTLDVVEVNLATPEPDGAVYHIVESGQAVWSIAIAYGTTINEIVGLNGLNPSNPQIFAGQTLQIRMANTPTVTPSLSPTPRPPTLTPSLTSTPVLTKTPTVTPTPTKKPLLPVIPEDNLAKSRPVGYILVGVSAVGLLLVILSALRRRPRQ